MKFTKMYDKGTRTYFWYLKITNFLDFMKYSQYIEGKAAIAWFKIYDSLSSRQHCPFMKNNSLEAGLFRMALCKFMTRECFSVQDYSVMVADLLKVKLNCLNKEGIIYVCHNGGFFHKNPHLEIIEEIEQEDIIFPENEYTDLVVDIKMWGGGTHYYVSVNETPIGDKFNSYTDACTFVERYMRNNFYGRKYTIKREDVSVLTYKGD